MADNARQIAESIAERVYEDVLMTEDSPDEPPTVHVGYVFDRNLPVNDMFQASELATDRAAMEFKTDDGTYRVLVYKVED
jgi:hypothetical protein